MGLKRMGSGMIERGAEDWLRLLQSRLEEPDWYIFRVLFLP